MADQLSSDLASLRIDRDVEPNGRGPFFYVIIIAAVIAPSYPRGMTKPPLVALLSGAGISTDSGIPDYRGPNGLWRRDPEAEKLVTYEYYMGDPEIRRRSWQMRRKNRTLKAEPNAAKPSNKTRSR